MHKWAFALLMGSVLSWSLAGAAFAAPTETPHVARLTQSVGVPPSASEVVLGLEPTVTETVQLSPGNEMIAQAIGLVFGVDEEEVIEIHDLVNGWGQVFKVFAVAKLTEQTPEDIVALREEGMGWGQIFKENDLKPGLGKNNLGGAVSGRTEPAETMTDTTTATTSDSTNQLNPNKGGPNSNPGFKPSDSGKGNSQGKEGKGKGHNK
jgi:hypothetical protein